MMQRSLLSLLSLLSLSFAVGAPALLAAAEPIIYSEDLSAGATIQDRDPGYRPSYLIYADTERSADDAKKLIDNLGLRPHLDEYKTRVYVMAPADGKAWDPVADLSEFQSFLKSHRSSNLKIIAIGAGATFVNNVISKHAFAVAGILTYGGTLAEGAVSTMPVPAYVHAANPAVASQYIAANAATKKTETPGWTIYDNPEVNHELQRVVASKLGDAKETPAQAFQNAWATVFSRNYRLYMKLMESYNQAFDPNNFTDPWELEPYVMYGELGMSYDAVVEDLPGLGLSLRYEYVPAAVRNAPAKSVPLVIMMHGNANDPRTQGESSGWVEVAAKNNIILTSVEWQGRKVKDVSYAAIGEAGTMAILDKLLAKFPQIDASRVYFTGLSAGAMNSLNYGMNNVARIAAIAPASAPFATAALLEAAKKMKADGNYLPMYFVAGNHDMYKPLPVNDTPRSFYMAIRAYALLDDIAVPDAPDLSVNELFGVKLDSQRWGDLGGTRALIGTLSNAQGVMIKLVGLDPYGHWNYKPAAADMWEFLSKYRRDLATGKLITASR